MASLTDTITTSSGSDTITLTMDGDLRYGILHLVTMYLVQLLAEYTMEQ
jgi:hypothetical protein